MAARPFPTSPKLALIAGLLSALLIGGVLAAATDTFLFGGNTAQSGDLDLDPTVSEADVEVALTTVGASSCLDLVYTDGPLVGTFDVDIDLAGIEALPGGGHRATVTEQRICIRNVGLETARLLLETRKSTGSDEDTLCSAGEAEAGDTTCGSGDGELDEILFVSVLTGADYGAEAPCHDGSAVGGFLAIDDGGVGATAYDTGIDIPVGAACPFLVEIIVNDTGDEDRWRAAQTDRVGFNLLVSLETP